MRLFRMLNVVDVQCREYYGDFSMNVFNIVIALIVQRRRFGANILMSVFAIMNVFNPQHRVCYDDYSMNVFNIATALVCNAVGVVLLIARGWRGTSLPRVNIRKGIQRHRC